MNKKKNYGQKKKNICEVNKKKIYGDLKVKTGLMIIMSINIPIY